MKKWWRDPIQRFVIIEKIRAKLTKNPPKIKKERFVSSRFIRELDQYGKWRQSILERDNYTCLKCGFKYEPYTKKDEGKYPLNVDHHPSPLWWLIRVHRIKTIKKAINCKNLWRLERGRTLCVPCHKLTGSYLKVPQKSFLKFSHFLRFLHSLYFFQNRSYFRKFLIGFGSLSNHHYG